MDYVNLFQKCEKAHKNDIVQDFIRLCNAINKPTNNKKDLDILKSVVYKKFPLLKDCSYSNKKDVLQYIEATEFYLDHGPLLKGQK